MNYTLVLLLLIKAALGLFRDSEKLSVKELVEKSTKFITFEIPVEELDCTKEPEELRDLCPYYNQFKEELKNKEKLEAKRKKFLEEEGVILKQLERSSFEALMECLAGDPQASSDLTANIKDEKHLIWIQPMENSPLSKLSCFGKCLREYWRGTMRGYKKHCKCKRIENVYARFLDLLEEPEKKQITQSTKTGSIAIAIGFAIFISALIITLIVMAIALKMKVDQQQRQLNEESNLV